MAKQLRIVTLNFWGTEAPLAARLAMAVQQLRELAPEQRNVLRMSLVEGLSVDELAPVFGVHRATAARLLQRARDAVSEGTKRRLTERLSLETSELESILRLVRSQLDLSISRHLERSKTSPARRRPG